MHRIALSLAALALFLCSAVVTGQGPEKMAPPTDQHKWLQRFVGEWETESKAAGGDGMAGKGTISCQSLGGYWIVSEMKADMGGLKFVGVQQIGYDAKTKKYVGTWVDSTNGHIWHYTGTVDKSGNVLTLEAEGPNLWADNKLTQFRDVYDFSKPGQVATSSLMKGEDGKWQTFMTGVATRKEAK